MSKSKPVLYYAKRSPPCRSVLMTAAAVGIELEFVEMNLLQGDHLTPAFLKLNPQHTIPVLDDNGLIITDSHVICGYLADTYSPNETLYPRMQRERMEVTARLFFDCGHLFPRLRMMIEPVLYGDCPEISTEKKDYMRKAYDGLEKCLANTPYLCGEEITIADLCCITSVTTADLVAPVDEQIFPKVHAWIERMKLLPYYKQGNQDGLDLGRKAIFEKLALNKRNKDES